MEFPTTLLDLAGAIALLMWGTHMVQSGIQRTFGARLRSALGHALRNRARAFAVGAGVTAVLQSSTATGLMTTGFVVGGFVDLVPALAVMLGANVGTSLVVQALSFDVAEVSPVLLLVGVLLFRRDTNTWSHDLGRVFIGFGLMLLALHQLLGLMTDFEDGPHLRVLLGAVATAPLLDVVLAAGMSWAAHSSIVVVLLVMSLASKNAIPPDAAIALVLGANLGTALNPLLEGPTSDDPATRRLPIGNLLTRLAGTLVALPFAHVVGSLLVIVEPDNARLVADFHTLFNLAVAAVALPLLGPYARLLQRWIPGRTPPIDPSKPLYLDSAAKETPIVALGAAAREALRLADVLGEMILGAKQVLTEADRRRVAETQSRDDVLDHLNTAIKTYLTSIDPDELGELDLRRMDEILAFSMNLEQAGDVVDRNLLPHLAKRIKRGLVFSREGETELVGLLDRLAANVRTAASVFITQDASAARVLADEKVAFRDAESLATTAHFQRLRSGHPDAVQTSALLLDLLRDMKQANSHVVAAAAYPLLRRSGHLLTSRIAAGADAPLER